MYVVLTTKQALFFTGPIQPVVSTPIHGQQSHTDQENEQLEQHSGKCCSCLHVLVQYTDLFTHAMILKSSV